MGQYGNQPDFGTIASNIYPAGDPDGSAPGESLKPAALYIGSGGTLVCTVVGGNINNYNSGATIFRNIPDGTFLPIIVTNVWDTLATDPGTTCSDIVALY